MCIYWTENEYTGIRNRKELSVKKEEERMGKVYFTIAGTEHYFGSDFLEAGMTVKLIKEPDNVHDREAIRVEMCGAGKIGYVANSTRTVLGESMSAGRLYDKIGKKAKGKVVMVMPQGVICVLKKD